MTTSFGFLSRWIVIYLLDIAASSWSFNCIIKIGLGLLFPTVPSIIGTLNTNSFIFFTASPFISSSIWCSGILLNLMNRSYLYLWYMGSSVLFCAALLMLWNGMVSIFDIVLTFIIYVHCLVPAFDQALFIWICLATSCLDSDLMFSIEIFIAYIVGIHFYFFEFFLLVSASTRAFSPCHSCHGPLKEGLSYFHLNFISHITLRYRFYSFPPSLVHYHLTLSLGCQSVKLLKKRDLILNRPDALLKRLVHCLQFYSCREEAFEISRRRNEI